MSTDQLEQRLAAIEQRLAAIEQRQLATPAAGPWWQQVGLPPMTDDQRKAFDEMVEYGRYFRKTGRDAPPDWKPGDPIPEPDSDE